jgi:hypothetical protein
VPLDARVLEVVVVGPDGNVQVKRKCQYIDVVGIALADSASGCRELAFVLRPFHDGDGEGGAGQKKSVEVERTLPGIRCLDFSIVLPQEAEC